jgi:Protein of unknown function (DUF3631)
MNADKLRALAGKLHALIRSDNLGERETARAKLMELLAKHKLSWNDLPELLNATNTDPANTASTDDGDKPAPPALDLIEEMLRRHLHLADHEYVALALWSAHTFFYSQFAVTPRLALLSPVRGCGKTTVIHLLLHLAFNARKFDHVTAAALFRTIDREHPCLLIDEADNQELPTTAALRSVLNSGHHRSGSIGRANEHAFSTFAPVAIAAIGRLPLPLMHRSIVLRMERAPRVNLRRFDPWTMPGQEAQCRAVYDQTFSWARQCTQGSRLNLNPTMPAELRNRQADNWRVLLAIADAAGPAC